MLLEWLTAPAAGRISGVINNLSLSYNIGVVINWESFFTIHSVGLSVSLYSMMKSIYYKWEREKKIRGIPVFPFPEQKP